MDRLLHLGWLPETQGWTTRLQEARALAPPQALEALIGLANQRIDFLQTVRLDRAVQQLAGQGRELLAAARPVRLAVLGSSTVSHLLPAMRVGALRRRLWVDVYEGPYGTYRQELQEPTSGLRAFAPDVVLICLDAHHLAEREAANAATIAAEMQECWRLGQSLGCVVIQQTALPVLQPLLGNNEHRYPQSPLAIIGSLNARLRELATAAGVHLLAVDAFAAQDGISEWYDEALWHRAKQEVHPRVSHVYGDQVGRLLAAIRGRSHKCLVLDLDNTLWGGVIGDDGMAGIALGQGSAVGEAHLAFQRYALELSRRGVILAVCSKNEEAIALEAFENHPEMLLRRSHLASFVANWDDKASNLRRIAAELNIGLDSLVLADDSPFERNLVRRELPQVAVPELPEDPAGYAPCIAAAGYFECLDVTAEDQERTRQYRANAEREQLRQTVTDTTAYLATLQMELHCRPFDQLGLPRIVQLINKTNQFNLTTQRYTEPEVQAVVGDTSALHLQLRLLDRFGDNGIIAVVIGKLAAAQELRLETWLMSCRVLGRQVEAATLNVLARRAREMGARTLIGIYRPTAKNALVKAHYASLGFELASETAGESTWRLDLDKFKAAEVSMAVVESDS